MTPEHSLNASIDGVNGYMWLACDLCGKPLKQDEQLDVGDSLDEMVAAAKTHQCTREGQS